MIAKDMILRIGRKGHYGNNQELAGGEVHPMDKEEEIFRDLLEKVRTGNFDDEYLQRLGELEQVTRDPALVPVFAAYYAAYLDEWEQARLFAEKAYRYRQINTFIWLMLVEIYGHLEPDYHLQMMFFQGLCKRFVDMSVQIPCFEYDEEKSAYLAGTAVSSEAPFYFYPRGSGEKETWHIKSACGEFLPGQLEDAEYKYYCGVYNATGFTNTAVLLPQIFQQHDLRNVYCYANFNFDIMRAKLTRREKICLSEHTPCVVPVAGRRATQEAQLRDGTWRAQYELGEQEFRFLRLEQDTEISSDEEMVVGTPIVLRHSPKRHKLVLSLFLDSLSWGQMKKEGYAQVPHLMEFFQKGIIFDNAYSESEYTFPSIANIETGMHTERCQIFNDKVFTRLNPEIKTISEQMHKLGYYCSTVMSDMRGVYDDVTRGMDRLVGYPYIEWRTYEGVKRLLDQLEAFEECDQYVVMQISDPHVTSIYQPKELWTQTHVPVMDMFFNPKSQETSVREVGTYDQRVNNLYNIRRMDEMLQLVFDYLSSYYDEDEYVVQAYSDHGVAIYEKYPYYFSETQCGSALMLRGAGVPQIGRVQELVSLLDIYPMMMRTVGFEAPQGQLDGCLPKAFGGPGRQSVLSQSIFPGQTYKMCLRDEAYEFRLETKAKTRMDGTIDMSEYTTELYTRDSRHMRVQEPSVEQRFLAQALEHTASFAHPFAL